MSPADQLAALPEPVQAELWRIARLAIGMSPEEKGAAAAITATVGLHFAVRPLADDNELFIPAAEMVSACGLIVRLVHDAAAQAAVEKEII
jgi:hypothetical protein